MASHPVIFKRYHTLVEQWDEFQATLQRPLPTCIWTNTLRITPQQLAELLTAAGVDFKPLPWHPDGFKLADRGKAGRHWAFLAGLYHIQEEVSMLPVALLDPQPGERILDMCAAPGNKTAQIAVKMANTGTVVANDLNFGRMRAARQALKRLGLINVSTTICNGTNYPKAAGQFDRILVDVPCSCEGTVRKEPGVVERSGIEVSCRKSGLQKALLRKAVRLCKVGGRVVYATCTFAPEENEGVVDTILRECGPSVLRVLPADIAGFNASAGVTSWNNELLDPSLKKTMRVWPHQNDTGGFFVAVLEKTAPASHNFSVEPALDLATLPPISEGLLQILTDRFGIAPADFKPYSLFQQGSSRAYLVNAHHQPPAQPRPDAIGMVLINTRTKFPKLSTAAAMQFGPAATQNYVDVDEAQRYAYVTRQQFYISAQQARYCFGVGYVLVRYLGYVLGVALYHPNKEGGGGTVTSQFPKGWSPAKK